MLILFDLIKSLLLRLDQLRLGKMWEALSVLGIGALIAGAIVVKVFAKRNSRNFPRATLIGIRRWRWGFPTAIWWFRRSVFRAAAGAAGLSPAPLGS